MQVSTYVGSISPYTLNNFFSPALMEWQNCEQLQKDGNVYVPYACHGVTVPYKHGLNEYHMQ